MYNLKLYQWYFPSSFFITFFSSKKKQEIYLNCIIKFNLSIIIYYLLKIFRNSSKKETQLSSFI